MINLFVLLYFLTFDGNVSGESKIVTKIIDGDTIIVQGGETIRLLGIDCDERGKACYTPAKNRIEEVLLNQVVILESENDDKDRYGRSLRWIFFENKNFNAQLVEEGYCVARFPEDSKYQEEVSNVEEKAINNKIGCKWENI